MRPSRPGFTLIELMIVVAIIGILAVVAIPKFVDLVRKANEASTKGSLGTLRNAISIYYGDMEGQFPATPLALTLNGKYLAAMPTARTPSYHMDTTAALLTSEAALFTDVGGWSYDNTPTDGYYGGLWVNCTHTDSRASVWTNY